MSAAGSNAVANTNRDGSINNPIELRTWTWTSDASGNVSGLSTHAIRGLLVNVSFQPGTGGAQPTDGYNVAITDNAGVDILNGKGASLSQTTATRIVPALTMTDGTTPSIGPVLLYDDVSLNVSGAGNAKSGTVRLYIKRP